MKIMFESDDDLSLGKVLSTPGMIIVVESAFQEDNNYHTQAYLHECFNKFVNEL